MQPAVKVSVIIPFYNAARTIGRCLDSVAPGPDDPWEVICVDDRSTDDSDEIVARYDVRLIHMIRRSGAATARNLAASVATGDLLFFVDADVIVPPGLIPRAIALFDGEAELDAAFGAYTIMPDAENFASVYKNLVHHHTHLTSRRRATSFWCGCGAIRREAFARVHGFDESYAAASVEDIDLGYRLTKSGARIRLEPSLRVVHAKRYTLRSLVRSDLWDRAVPWTKLMAREGIFKLDLNLKFANVLAALVLVAVLALVPVGLLWLPRAWTLSAIALGLAGYFLLNLRIWWYVLKVKGPLFSVAFLVMFSITYLYSVLGFALGLVLFILESIRGKADHAV